jgi:formimidoylglutamate deiminase
VCDGTIIAVERDAADARADDRLAGIVLPGLPNLHSHTFQRGMAGLAERRGPARDDFWTWREVMYHFLKRIVPENIEAIAAFAMMEMLESGFTALGEFHYLHNAGDGTPYANIAELAERIIAAADATGIGLTLLPVLYAQGGFDGRHLAGGKLRFGADLDTYLRLLAASEDALRGLDDAAIGIAPHSLRAVGPDMMRGLLQAVPDGPVHMHLAEQTKEVEDCMAWSGQRPASWLLAHADVDARWCLVHATHIDAQETQAIAASGAVVGLCPLTEADLGDGIFPGLAYASAGGRWGVGTDSNIEITAPGELKQFEYGQRLARRARNVLAAGEHASTGRSLYDAALSGGARSLGRRIGAVAPGFRADLVTLDTRLPGFAAAGEEHVLDIYLFAAGRDAVRDVLVGGRRVVTDGMHHRRVEITSRYIGALRRISA